MERSFISKARRWTLGPYVRKIVSFPYDVDNDFLKEVELTVKLVRVFTCLPDRLCTEVSAP